MAGRHLVSYSGHEPSAVPICLLIAAELQLASIECTRPGKEAVVNERKRSSIAQIPTIGCSATYHVHLSERHILAHDHTFLRSVDIYTNLIHLIAFIGIQHPFIIGVIALNEHHTLLGVRRIGGGCLEVVLPSAGCCTKFKVLS